MASPPGCDSTVLLSKRDSVAEIALNRPEVINAFNVRMRDELFQAMEAVRDDPGVRAAILRGAGDRGFCAGADLTEFGTAPSQAVAREVRWARDLWGLFASIEKPVVAALHGHVIGSGLEMAALCDIRLASEDAVFSMPEASLAMLPAAGGTQTLSRVVGRGRAMEVLMSGRTVGAAEAQRMGLVSAVVAPDRLLTEVRRIARALALLDAAAVSALKKTVRHGTELTLEQGLAMERRLAARLEERAAGERETPPSQSFPAGGGRD